MRISRRACAPEIQPFDPDFLLDSRFYDTNPHACGWDDTAVGGINLRGDSNETLDGFQGSARFRFPSRL